MVARLKVNQKDVVKHTQMSLVEEIIRAHVGHRATGSSLSGHLLLPRSPVDWLIPLLVHFLQDGLRRVVGRLSRA